MRDKEGERKPAPAPADRKLLLLNKPYMVLCQFTDEAGRETLRITSPSPVSMPRAGSTATAGLCCSPTTASCRRASPSQEKTPRPVGTGGRSAEEKLAALRAGVGSTTA